MTRALRRAMALLGIATSACAAPPERPDGPPIVVATIAPVADLVARIAGDAADVRTLLPPRASPSTWEATPGQIRAVGGAVGYVSVGGGLDGWLDDAVAPGTARLRLADGLTLRHADEGHGEGTSGDPHVWLDPMLVREALLPRVTTWLGELFPSQRPALEARGAALADSLVALDAEIRAGLDRAPLRSFVATHDAWAYFADRYALTPLGSLYERPGHEPSARGLAALVKAARGAGLGVILAEPQLAETAARALAAELGGAVVVVDPLGGRGQEGREDYLSLMRFNARAFAHALGVR